MLCRDILGRSNRTLLFVLSPCGDVFVVDILALTLAPTSAPPSRGIMVTGGKQKWQNG